MRMALFTDTLADMNGPSRFIRAVASHALRTGRDVTVFTSTRLPLEGAENIVNVPAVWARAMPGYASLQLAWPDRRRLERAAMSRRPDVIHVSTPGPVGYFGRGLARKHGIPLVGTYHTDFPAYAMHLFQDEALSWLCARLLSRFYGPFTRVLTRSAAYVRRVAELGIEPERLVPLRPGVDTRIFSPTWRDEGVWTRVTGGPLPGVKVLCVGRVSVEKNLKMVAAIWPGIAQAARLHGVVATLVIVGHGPYLAEMKQALEHRDAVFLGKREGEELSRIYASSDLFLFPSTTDTLGQAVLEAQASGLVSVVSNQGGPCEVVGMTSEGPTGVVIPTERHERWSGEVLSLIVDQSRRERMRRAAEIRGRELTIEASLEHFFDCHHAVVARQTAWEMAGA